MLRAVDLSFVGFHTGFVIFNVLGWLIPSWRRANLIALLLTGASWFGLGIFYGLGYCPFTDWHWTVLQRLGESDLPASYMQYLVMRLLGLDLRAAFVDAVVAVGFFAALLTSVVLNIRDAHRRRVAAEREPVPLMPPRSRGNWF